MDLFLPLCCDLTGCNLAEKHQHIVLKPPKTMTRDVHDDVPHDVPHDVPRAISSVSDSQTKLPNATPSHKFIQVDGCNFKEVSGRTITVDKEITKIGEHHIVLQRPINLQLNNYKKTCKKNYYANLLNWSSTQSSQQLQFSTFLCFSKLQGKEYFEIGDISDDIFDLNELKFSGEYQVHVEFRYGKFALASNKLNVKLSQPEEKLHINISINNNILSLSPDIYVTKNFSIDSIKKLTFLASDDTNLVLHSVEFKGFYFNLDKVNHILKKYYGKTIVIKYSGGGVEKTINYLVPEEIEKVHDTFRSAFLTALSYKQLSPSLLLNGTIPDSEHVEDYLDELYLFNNIDILNDAENMLLKCDFILKVKDILYYLNEVRAKEKHFFIHIACHGTNVRTNNQLEEDGKDEFLVFSDGFYQDDYLNRLLNHIHVPNLLITAVTDCCHSGSMLDLDVKLASENDNKIIGISGCQDQETSGETAKGGYLTTTLLSLVTKPISIKDLSIKINKKLVAEKAGQTSVLSTNHSTDVFWLGINPPQ